MNIFSSFRLYSTNNLKMQRRINKSTYPVDESSPFYNKTIRLFHDDTLQTFYRRICFSPDGLLMYVVPANSSSSQRPIKIITFFILFIASHRLDVPMWRVQLTIHQRKMPIRLPILCHLRSNLRPLSQTMLRKRHILLYLQKLQNQSQINC